LKNEGIPLLRTYLASLSWKNYKILIFF
jgi:hypothetical protein